MPTRGNIVVKSDTTRSGIDPLVIDQQTRLLMGDELLRIWRDTGATIVLITHALDEAANEVRSDNTDD